MGHFDKEFLEKSLEFVSLVGQANSDDDETKVGCAIYAYDYELISEGANSFCNAWRSDVLPRTRPHKYEFMIHAEVNAIINCTKEGKKIPENAVLVCSLSPCPNCLRLAFMAGVRFVIFRDYHPSFKDSLPDFEIKKTIEGETTILELSEN